MNIDKNVEEDGVIFMSIKDDTNAEGTENAGRKTKTDGELSGSREKEDILILAIESSCDESAAAVVKNGREVIANVVASQIDIHKEYGGVIPEIAAREGVLFQPGLELNAFQDVPPGASSVKAIARESPVVALL